MLGIVGKPSSGKSTFFSAATLISVPISERPFTTIEPNTGIAHVRVKDIGQELGVKAQPRKGFIMGGYRFIPIELRDVAGLVPDAHKGKGLGNEFLNDLISAEGLIHVVDLSGNLDPFGNPGEGDPFYDAEWLEKEIDFWIEGILEKHWKNIERRAKTEPLWEVIYTKLSGLRISKEKVREIVEKGFGNLFDLAQKIRQENKPILIAGNKIDIADEAVVEKAEKTWKHFVPVSALAELVLKKAAKAGKIRYIPGEGDFEIIGEITEEQREGLEYVRKKVLKRFGSTGVQQALEKMVFEVLDYIVVYPVEDERRLSDKKGNVLPDAFLVKRGTTAKELAYLIHSEMGEKFICAIDVKTGKRLAKDYMLQDGDIIKIHF